MHMTPEISKKRASESDDIYSYSSGKRIRLDNLFDGLSLGGDRSSPEQENSIREDFVINPNVETYSVYKKKISKPRSNTSSGITSDFSSYLAEKLVDHFNEEMLRNLQVIPWYDYRFLVIYRFERWAVRLFNRFLREFNKRNNLRIGPMRNYDKILKLVEEQKITANDLFNILDQMCHAEMAQIEKRKWYRSQKQDESHFVDEAEILKDTRYDYWDTLNIDRDSAMSENEGYRNDLTDSKVEELPLDEQDMEMEDWGDDIMADYGSYYGEYRDNNSEPMMA
ncbi:predicted protein [Scheffersomyces stipitis CBS 6054]|uniref:Uncharacterized protein n=1 Tax=Scheffersomyces stipitis (strain ATCC 58785 / CBS 6054 / NBRC 10063 / NRRL Y-11545) TaxID=322104 RepID=A3LR15_PICST|nr:predicted protein [Scheffersomyces stipitis CBS 6054]ABN65306.2 predicted protein [Scheffersomyces stipitis CBS 6054]